MNLRNRREFFESVAVLPAAYGLAKIGQVARSRVVIAADANMKPSLSAKPDSERLLALINNGIQALAGLQTPVEAWGRFVTPSDTVGLKVNCLAGRGLSTSVQLVEVLIESLKRAGVAPSNIIIWDRHSNDLEAAGFRIVTDGNRPRCYGNDIAGFEPELSVLGSVGSLLSQTLTRRCSVVINLPVLKDHGIAGVSVALKNLFGAIHNPNKYHGNVGDPYVADVFALPEVRSKVKLTICDALTAQYEGGPPFMPQWCWLPNSLVFAVDPVALDYTAWQMIEQKRAQSGVKPLRAAGRYPSYIATAADSSHRLGTNDPARIELLKV